MNIFVVDAKLFLDYFNSFSVEAWWTTDAKPHGV